jgi:hypothetical protein
MSRRRRLQPVGRDPAPFAGTLARPPASSRSSSSPLDARSAAADGSDKDGWNDPPRSLDDWEQFVRTMAGGVRRHRNLASYEIYNEENVAQWWDGSVSP